MPGLTALQLQQTFVATILPTITAWNRIEGRPRTHEFERALQARIHDPMWMLCRQWQLGEFRGEDAGSPVRAKILIDDETLTHYQPGNAAPEALPDELPLEAVLERRPVELQRNGLPAALDLSLSIGRHWFRLLDSETLPTTYREKFKDAYPLQRPDPALPENASICAHEESWQRFAAAAGRSMDGAGLIRHLLDSPANRAQDGVADLAPGDVPTIDGLGDELLAWYRRWLEQPTEDDSWQPSRLEYQCAVATGETEPDKVLTATEYYHGRLDWFNFDWGNVVAAPDAATSRKPEAFIPNTAEFDGMPHPRWWQFEEGKTNLGRITPSTTDIAKLLFLEFGLIYANDWYIFPHTLPAKSISRVVGLQVDDVFGDSYWIQAAGEDDDSNWQRWNLFDTTDPQVEDPVDTPIGSRLLLLPTSPKTADSQRQEHTMLIRDEMANMVWGIERAIRLPSGDIKRGVELANETATFHRGLIQRAIDDGAMTPPEDVKTAAVRYEVMKTVPENWIPFVPVHEENDNRQTRLQRAAMPRIIEGDENPPLKIRPRNQVLRQGMSTTGAEAYYIDEEEVSRAGISIFDGFQRTRWYGGKVVTWRGLRKHTGRGEGSSGLAFDTLKPQRKDEPPAEPVDSVAAPPSIDVTGPNAPTISVAATPDGDAGWNVEISTTNFVFAPQNASTAHVEGEGHMHFYLNGIKISRLYAEHFHIPRLPEGEFTLQVEISANNHAVMMVDGEPVSAGLNLVSTGATPASMPTDTVPASSPAPAVSLMVHDDAKAGYNVHVMATDFVTHAATATGSHVNGEGYVQLYVNDNPLSRMYGGWHYLPPLTLGEHTIRVELRGNDHRIYESGGQAIQAEDTITVSEISAGHSH